MTITKRLTKGSALTHSELDGNFDHLEALTEVWYFDAGGSVSTARPTTINGSAVASTDIVIWRNHTTAKPTNAGTNDLYDVPEPWVIQVSDQTTDLTTGTAKMTVWAPFAFTLNSVRAWVATAPTGADLEVDVNKNGTSVLSTVISIDATEDDSDDSATPAVISTSSFAAGDKITFDIDQVGSTVAGAGLAVVLYLTRTD